MKEQVACGTSRFHPDMRTKSARWDFPILAYFLLLIAALLVLATPPVAAQTDLPDAPRPQNNLPPPQAPAPQPPEAGGQPTAPPAAASPAASQEPANTPEQAPPGSEQPSTPQVTTVPAGEAPPKPPASPRDELYKYRSNVNFVTVPVTVKDANGYLVEGLLRNDFAVYENGERQNITFFTSDPFPLSAAIVLDTALESADWNKVRDTLSALVGAFSEFDEVSIFTYSNTVQKIQDFSGLNATVLSASLRRVRSMSGNVGMPMSSGSMAGGPTPSVNGRPFDPSVSPVQTVPRESYVLNDAILEAANELSRRDDTRRLILFVIGDGREFGSSSSYADVLRVLLTRQISVYAVGITNIIPGYRQAQRIRIPGLGYSNILPKYASATGGQVYDQVTAQAMEEAYSRITREARNQYTLGYTTRATPSTAYRSIEVRVHRPNLKVYARDGYYPLPPGK